MDDEGKTVGVGCDQFHILAVEEASGGLSFADALVDDNFDGTYSCSVRPKNIGIYSVQVKLFGIHVVGSPFDMEVVPVRVQLKEEEEKKKEEVLFLGYKYRVYSMYACSTLRGVGKPIQIQQGIGAASCPF